MRIIVFNTYKKLQVFENLLWLEIKEFIRLILKVVDGEKLVQNIPKGIWIHEATIMADYG